MKTQKKKSDLYIFIVGWAASTLAVGVPTGALIFIKHLYPEAVTSYGDRITVITYLVGAFFSGWFTTYRVVCKSNEKDIEIESYKEKASELQKDIDDAKKAYRSLSPKSKIISILTDIHDEAKKLTTEELSDLLIKKIKEINNDSTFEPRYDGMIIHVSDNDYKLDSSSVTSPKANLRKYVGTRFDKGIIYKSRF
ncbi:hypothetical protein R2200_004195, partial [Cronobacter malonaticus]|nr:hypothetical protein [Cronobacter malonaticus]